MTTPPKHHSRKFKYLVNQREDNILLSDVVQVRVESLQHLVFIESLFICLYVVVMGCPLFVVDVLVEHGSDENGPGSKNKVVKCDVIIVEQSLATPLVVAAVEKVGQGKCDVFVIEVLDHFCYSDV